MMTIITSLGVAVVVASPNELRFKRTVDPVCFLYELE